MSESFLAVVLALILVFGAAVGILRLMGPSENQESTPGVEDGLVREPERRVV